MFYYEVAYIKTPIDLKLPTKSKTYHFKSDFRCKKGSIALVVNGNGSVSAVRVVGKLKDSEVSEECKNTKIAKILRVCNV